MIEKEILELVVKKVMDKFAKKNDGSRGWVKEDIENEILLLGGTMTDVYESMKIGFNVCLNDYKFQEPLYC
ncbi:TPA: hypothetical protein ACS82W_001586 [Streptococcus pneumoniae]